MADNVSIPKKAIWIEICRRQTQLSSSIQRKKLNSFKVVYGNSSLTMRIPYKKTFPKNVEYMREPMSDRGKSIAITQMIKAKSFLFGVRYY